MDNTRTALLESQRRVLERIASGAPLEEILGTLVRLIEEQAAGMRCAVLLADAARERLRFVAAPHLPEDYRLCMEPYLQIAPNMGSCGTAAYLREPVYTSDTAADPLWEGCREVAVRYGLRAIWSTPILSDDNRVLGTFAMYYGEPGLPAEEHIQLIDMATQMARVAIGARFDDAILRAMFDGAQNAMVVTDLGGTIVRVNPAFAHLLGQRPADLHGRDIAEITEGADYPALVAELLKREEVAGERCYRTGSGELFRARERASLRRDAAGQPRYVLTLATEAHSNPLIERLSRRERGVLELVVSGHTSKEIAARLGIAPASVDTYRSRMMLKLAIDNLAGLVRFAIQHGIAGE